ncbi:hypothetical protein BGZ82_002574, partial [Podila clonocystis]
YDFRHSISKDLVEHVDGLEIIRARRVSITYRDMLVEDREQGRQADETGGGCKVSYGNSSCTRS